MDPSLSRVGLRVHDSQQRRTKSVMPEPWQITDTMASYGSTIVVQNVYYKYSSC
jgi:hypothetical protein